MQFRKTFDDAVAETNATARASALAQLVASGDDVAVRGTLAKLSGEGLEGALALRPLLEDDSLLSVHFQILDSIVHTGAREMHFDSIIQHETEYWIPTCRQELEDRKSVV